MIKYLILFLFLSSCAPTKYLMSNCKAIGGGYYECEVPRQKIKAELAK